MVHLLRRNELDTPSYGHSDFDMRHLKGLQRLVLVTHEAGSKHDLPHDT